MQIKLTINGNIQIGLTPETPIERATMSTAEEAASKGIAVKLVKSGEDGYLFLIEAV